MGKQFVILALATFMFSAYEENDKPFADDCTATLGTEAKLTISANTNGSLHEINLSTVYALGLRENAFQPLLPSLGVEDNIRTPLLKVESSGGFAMSTEPG